VILGMTSGTYGFPSSISDDPVLDLAMPASESFPYAEERRLLYAGLTRARRQVTLITGLHLMSPFVIEMIDAGKVIVEGDNWNQVRTCPKCHRGLLVERNGRYGQFLGCTRLKCDHTQNLGR